ncbi:MAG: iron uptake porin [Elainellaceae cyanobacterium]
MPGCSYSLSAIATPEPTISTPSVSQLSPVTPDDWAFQALQSLGDRCLPVSEEFEQGDRAISRNDFAILIDACAAAIQEQMQTAQNRGDRLDAETLATWQRLQFEFAEELAVLQEQVQSLETRTTVLEAQSFAPQVELEGEVIFAAILAAGTTKADDSGESVNDNVLAGNRFRLALETSFTGADELQIGLQARNVPELEAATGTQMANLGFDGADDNDFEIDEIGYEFLIGQQTGVSIGITGSGLGDFVPTVNPLFSGSGDGSISVFGRENPIRRQGEGMGIGVSHDFSDAVNLSLGYVASEATDRSQGLFYGPYGAIAQLTVLPSETAGLSLTYVRSYNGLNTGTGSTLANDPFNEQSAAITANAIGAEASFQLSPSVNLGGRFGWMQATAEDLSDQPVAESITWAALLSVTDLWQEGDLAGFIIGQPPKLIENDLGEDFEDTATSLHWEAFYRYPLTDDLAITPGVLVITNPDHDRENEAIYVGVVRATFTF